MKEGCQCLGLFKKESTSLSTVHFSEINQRYLNEENYKEAYLLERKRYELVKRCGLEIMEAPNLLRHFVSLLQEDKVDESITTGNMLLDLIVFLEEKTENVLNYARLLQKKNRKFESLFFNLLAQKLCFQEEIFDFGVMNQIVTNVVIITRTALKEEKLFKSMVSGLIAPTIMVRIQETWQILNETKSKDKSKYLLIPRLFFLLSSCYYAADDYKEFISFINAAILYCERVFGIKANQHRIYGICLHYLGFMFLEKNVFEEAKSYLEKADNALSKAQDYVEMDRGKGILNFNKKCLEVCNEIV